jgi:hypothetical protein
MKNSEFKHRYNICITNDDRMYHAILAAVKLSVNPPPTSVPVVDPREVQEQKNAFIAYINNIPYNEANAFTRTANPLEIEITISKNDSLREPGLGITAINGRQ